MKQFTAIEVRQHGNCLDSPEREMLYAFADMLEAREKAVPVYQYKRKSGPIWQWFDCSAEEYEAMEQNIFDKEHFDRRILYTHPAPSDAERLAEALRDDEHEWPASLNIRDTKLHDDMGGPGQRIYTTAGRGYKTMKYIRHDLAHSAQAQLKNVPFVRETWPEDADGDLPDLCTVCGKPVLYGTRHTTCADAQIQPNIPDLTDEEWEILFHLYPELKARLQKVFDAHDAQAQPPAASVPEVTGLTWEPPNVTVDVERVGRFRSGDEHIVRVTFRSSDDGRRMTCFYSANKSAAEYLHAMLAAQENPNG